MFGWWGKGLEVDLGSGEIVVKRLPREIYEMYLGGRGLGVKLLWDHLQAGIDPLSPQNVMIFAAGPLTGTRAPAAGRHAVVTKSPLTGTIFDGNAGGYWGTALKKAGYDYILFKGRAPSPVFLLIRGDRVSLESAAFLWGKNTDQTIRLLKDKFPAEGKRRYGIACIGRAGENGVAFACIMNDRGNTCGRGGLGAVMGSKNLKAVVVGGEETVPLADDEAFEEYRRDILRLLVASPVSSKGLSSFGTSVLVNLINYMKLLPTDNFRRVYFEEAYEVSGEKIRDNYERKKRACFGCPIACKSRAGEMEIPEYETLALLGPACNNSSLESIMEMNHLCNDYGLDTITTGATLSCYAEILGRDLLQEEMLELIREVGEHEGAGAQLSRGSALLAAKMGQPGAAMQVKKLELPGYDPRGALGMALGYATSNRGGCHLRAYMIGPEIFGKPKLLNRLTFVGKSGLLPVFQNFFTTMDSLVVCKFVSFSAGEEELAAILSSVTGVHFSAQDLLRIGERIWNLERLFNLREGFSVSDDTLPERFFHNSDDGYAKGLNRDEFMRALREYYFYRGWTEEGVPTGEKLTQLGIN
ncbi:MAG: aldehyde ferredoxin oxidoreductase family protein [Bacillota bacterium]|nr:aldehyde ferredoxin oxidoreductase family protein [Bacillota bacterium]